MNLSSKTTAYSAMSALRALALLSSSAAAIALFTAPAQAQDGGATPADESDNAAIIVTGSRIARPDLESAVPATVVSPERIQQTGATNIQDALAQLPQVGQNLSKTSSNFANTGNGAATVNLRNLGSSRTLVLIDGHRTLGMAGTSSVDVNNIPTELVERVEVVTGGASAVYGSDAIAGVVNFILKDKFEGLSVHAQQRLSDKGDANDYYVSVTGGLSFFDGRANIVGNFSYDNDDGLRSRNRAFSAHDVPNRSSFAAQGLFSVDGEFLGGNGQTFTFDRNNQLKTYQAANIDGYDRNQDRYLSVPVDRYLGTLLGSFEFSNAAKLYFQAQYAKTKSNASLEASAMGAGSPPEILNFDETPFEGIPITSPYMPQGIRDAAIAAETDVVQFRRRSNDIFSRSNRNDRDFYRGVIGLRGDFGSSWSYDLSYEHSQSRDHTTTGAIYIPNYGAALNNESDGAGGVRCVDAAARAAGCVPVNIFGFNTVSAAAAKFLTTYTGPTTDKPLYIDGDPTNTAPSNIQLVHVTNGQNIAYDYLAKVYQDVAALNVSGKLFSLWGDPIGVSVGAEYRKERSSEVFDPFTQLGLSSGNQISNTIGSFDVKEIYGETVVPIVQDIPLFKYLGLEAAVRYADYSTVGGVWSWKVGGEYAPSRDLRLRAMFSRATRAPNIGELFSAKSQTFPAITDPCDQNDGNGDLDTANGQTPGSLPALSAKCAAIPGVANTVASPRGAFYYGTAQIQSIDGLLGGNPNLKAEEADTFTAGVVLTPSFLSNFSLTADYYTIKVKNAIGIVGQQVSVQECYDTDNPFFCGNVIRDPNTGFIRRVNALNLNTGSYLVSGLDIQGRYAFNVGARWKLSADVMWNHRFKQQQTPYPGGDIQDEMGQADCYSCGRLGSGFKDRVNGTAAITDGKYTVSYNFNYMGPLFDNLDGSVATPTRIPAYMYHNAKVTAKFAGKYEFYVGVNNIGDKLPPLFGDTNPVTWPGTQTVADTYDVYGRMVFFGTTLKF